MFKTSIWLHQIRGECLALHHDSVAYWHVTFLTVSKIEANLLLMCSLMAVLLAAKCSTVTKACCDAHLKGGLCVLSFLWEREVEEAGRKRVREITRTGNVSYLPWSSQFWKLHDVASTKCWVGSSCSVSLPLFYCLMELETLSILYFTWCWLPDEGCNSVSHNI